MLHEYDIAITVLLPLLFVRNALPPDGILWVLYSRGLSQLVALVPKTNT